MRVLIADEDRETAEALREVLASGGYHAEAVWRSELATLFASRFDPDVAALDIHALPDVHAVASARRARSDDIVLIAPAEMPQVPIGTATNETRFDHRARQPVDLAHLGTLLQGMETMASHRR